MAVYTVHEPPLRAADDAPELERFKFVRDGFSAWAFLLAPLWMLWHRMWLVLFCYLILIASLDAALVAVGASSALVFLAAMVVSLLVGLEASTLRRFTLSRRGWKNVGVASGDDAEAAERRFFAAWVQEASKKQRTPSAAPAAAPRAPSAPVPRPAQAPGVIGLFPEPGARR